MKDPVMIELDVKAECWYEALSLQERVDLLSSDETRAENPGRYTERGKKRLERWRSQSSFHSDLTFRGRLAADQIGEEELLVLFSEPPSAVRERLAGPPKWLTALADALSNRAVYRSLDATRDEDDTSSMGMSQAIKVLIDTGRGQLEEKLNALFREKLTLPVDPTTIGAILASNLFSRCNQILTRTMVLELNIARLQGLLAGETPLGRFREFLNRMSDGQNLVDLLREYPVLARNLQTCIEQWVNVSFEFVYRLTEDWNSIQMALRPNGDLDVVVAIREKGDRHRNGRSVLIAEFSSGFQVVYKPRSLGVQVHFQELLFWVNQRRGHSPLKQLRVLDRGNYGWMEFGEAQPCSSEEELWRFYYRQGEFLALLYLLEGKDFHAENLLAAGEYPLLLDLEGLFHPCPDDIDSVDGWSTAHCYLSHSILNTGLLPAPRLSNGEALSIDVSGLGGFAGQVTPTPVPGWEDVGTDQMRLTRKCAVWPGEKNQPTLNGNRVNPQSYSGAIKAGFADLYRVIMIHRADLSSSDGPVAAFACDEVRLILRDTQTYGNLLFEASHPDMLRDALDVSRMFDQLWAPVARRPNLARVFRAECEDLWRGDIPIFATHPNSYDVWTSSGERIPKFFNESGLERVLRRLQELSEQDLSRQLWLIDASLATLPTDLRPRKVSPIPATDVLPTKDYLLSAARKVGDRLEELAIQGDGDASWMGVDFNDERCSILVLGLDLYDGVPGVSLFLAFLGEVTGVEKYKVLARAAVSTMLKNVERSQSSMISVGGFAGWGGVVYALTHLAVLWNEASLLSAASRIAALVSPLIEQSLEADIIDGISGCLGSLFSLYQTTRSNNLLATMIRCGELLLVQAQEMPQGISWNSKHSGTKPLGGMAHGNAGIACQLLELYGVTSDERFRAAAESAVKYERNLFCPEAGNWLDLRRSPQSEVEAQPRFTTAWCHGAPGIGLARLRGLRHFDNAETRGEIEAALATTARSQFGQNHSLCHGDTGKLDFVLQASGALDFAHWRPHVDRMAGSIMRSVEQEGWLCGNPSNVESPGLMTGLSGIGFGFLRLAYPSLVPSVLTLAPPVGY